MNEKVCWITLLLFASVVEPVFLLVAVGAIVYFMVKD